MHILKPDTVTYRLAGKTAGGFTILFMKCTHPRSVEGMMGIFCLGCAKLDALQERVICVIYIIVTCEKSFSRIKYLFLSKI